QSTPACNSTCTNGMIKDVASCSGLSSDEAIAVCSCSKSVLTSVFQCGSCVVGDPANVSGLQALLQYNGFVEQCISVGFATTDELATLPAARPTVVSATSTITLGYQATGTAVLTAPKVSASLSANSLAAPVASPSVTSNVDLSSAFRGTSSAIFSGLVESFTSSYSPNSSSTASDPSSTAPASKSSRSLSSLTSSHASHTHSKSRSATFSTSLTSTTTPPFTSKLASSSAASSSSSILPDGSKVAGAKRMGADFVALFVAAFTAMILL
ncbi:hypothetical protein P7C70_g7424, partial [Phenoliferia sp. Uapishka_3]